MAMQTGHYPLVKPITIVKSSSQGDVEETIIEVFMRPDLTAGDLRVMDAHEGQVGKTIALIAQACSIPVVAVNKMSAVDFRNLGERLEKNGADGLTTGAIV